MERFYRRILVILCSLLVYQTCLSQTVTAPEMLLSKDESAQTPASRLTLTLPSRYSDSRPNRYIESLIREAFITQQVGVRFSYFHLPVNQKRISKQLLLGKDISLAWLPADNERMAELNYIPVPLYSGLHGKRLLLIHQDNLSDFASIDNIKDLSRFTGLLKRSWLEYTILTANGLKVFGELDQSGMLTALHRREADYYPRSVLTIMREQALNRELNIIIEPTLLLSFPDYYLFFMTANGGKWQSTLNKGMLTLYRSGRLTSLFNEFYAHKLHSLALSERKMITMEHPQLSAGNRKILESFLTDERDSRDNALIPPTNNRN